MYTDLQSIRPSNQLAPMSSRPTKQLAPLVNQLAPCINIGRVGIQCYEPTFAFLLDYASKNSWWAPT